MNSQRDRRKHASQAFNILAKIGKSLIKNEANVILILIDKVIGDVFILVPYF